MFKTIIKLLLICTLFAGAFSSVAAFDGAVDLSKIDTEHITDVSIKNFGAGEDPVYAINSIGFSILTTAKLILQ